MLKRMKNHSLNLKKSSELLLKQEEFPVTLFYLMILQVNSLNLKQILKNSIISLKNLGIECIELIPGRNDFNILKNFVEFFHKKGFIITFGTEHNTPEMIPLTVTARGSVPLDESLKRIAWEGACVIAAHQYLRADGRQGYVLA